jgi:hypothetical protein
MKPARNVTARVGGIPRPVPPIKRMTMRLRTFRKDSSVRKGADRTPDVVITLTLPRIDALAPLRCAPQEGEGHD